MGALSLHYTHLFVMFCAAIEHDCLFFSTIVYLDDFIPALEREILSRVVDGSSG